MDGPGRTFDLSSNEVRTFSEFRKLNGLEYALVSSIPKYYKIQLPKDSGKQTASSKKSRNTIYPFIANTKPHANSYTQVAQSHGPVLALTRVHNHSHTTLQAEELHKKTVASTKLLLDQLHSYCKSIYTLQSTLLYQLHSDGKSRS